MGANYFSALLHGITLHEIASCTYFLFSLGLENPAKQVKRTIFWLCLLTLFTGMISFGFLTAILNWYGCN
jgi:hypothetical protein